MARLPNLQTSVQHSGLAKAGPSVGEGQFTDQSIIQPFKQARAWVNYKAQLQFHAYQIVTILNPMLTASRNLSYNDA